MDKNFWAFKPKPVQKNKLILNKKFEEFPEKKVELPNNYKWSDIDINDNNQLEELYIFLSENYIEDGDNMFRLEYSKDFIRWQLQKPGYIPEWFCSIRNLYNKIVGFISAIPINILINLDKSKFIEINFLCVDKKYRSKRFAPILIREITRRINMNNYFHAIYTSGNYLPRPIVECQYWHRSLNPKKLIDIKFSYLPKDLTMTLLIKKLKLPKNPLIPGLRLLEEKDITDACNLINKYLNKFSIRPFFILDTFKHTFMSKKNIISTYVVEDEKTKKITDIISYFSLPSKIVNNKDHKYLNAAYSFIIFLVNIH